MYGWWHSRNAEYQHRNISTMYKEEKAQSSSIQSKILPIMLALCMLLKTACNGGQSPSRDRNTNYPQVESVEDAQAKEEIRNLLDDQTFLRHLYDIIQARNKDWWTKEQKIPLQEWVYLQISHNAINIIVWNYLCGRITTEGCVTIYVTSAGTFDWFESTTFFWTPIDDPKILQQILKKLETLNALQFQKIARVLNNTELSDIEKQEQIRTILSQ